MIKRITEFISLAMALLIIPTGFANGQENDQSKELAVGDKAPDFEVTTLAGNKWKLSSRFGEDGKPTILLFSRANW